MPFNQSSNRNGIPNFQRQHQSSHHIKIHPFRKYECPKLKTSRVIRHKTASPPQTDGSSYSPGGANVPSHVGTLAPSGKYDWTCASFGPPESTTQRENRLVQPFLHSSWQKVPILYSGRPFPPKLPLLMGDLDPHVTSDSLGPHELTIQMASHSVQPFLHRWPQSVLPA